MILLNRLYQSFDQIKFIGDNNKNNRQINVRQSNNGQIRLMINDESTLWSESKTKQEKWCQLIDRSEFFPMFSLFSVYFHPKQMKIQFKKKVEYYFRKKYLVCVG